MKNSKFRKILLKRFLNITNFHRLQDVFDPTLKKKKKKKKPFDPEALDAGLNPPEQEVAQVQSGPAEEPEPVVDTIDDLGN